jgi:hypothetical protein
MQIAHRTRVAFVRDKTSSTKQTQLVKGCALAESSVAAVSTPPIFDDA